MSPHLDSLIGAADDHGSADGEIQTLLAEAAGLVAAEACGLFLVDEAGANLELWAGFRFPDRLADRYRLIPLSANLPLVDAVKAKAEILLGSLADYQARYPDFTQAHPEIAQYAFGAVPLVIDDRCAGAVALGFKTAHAFSGEERDGLAVLARRCAAVVARLEAERTTRRLATRVSTRLERLQGFTGALAQAISPAQVVETIVDIGVATTAARGGELWLLEPDGAHVVPARRAGPAGPVAAEPAVARLAASERTAVLDAIAGGVAIWIESRSQHEERYPEARGAAPLGDGAVACLPLFTEGRCTGAVAYGFEGVHRFPEDERASLQLMAWYAGQALERAGLYAAEKAAKERAETARRRSDFLADVGVILASSLDDARGSDADAHLLADVAAATVPRFADWCILELADERLSGAAPVACHVDPAKVPLVLEIRRRLRARSDFDRGITAVIRSGISQRNAWLTPELIREQFAGDEELIDLMGQVGVASALVVPISARGQVLGAVVLVRSTLADAYDDRDLGCAEELGRRVGLALDNARLYQAARTADRQKDEFLAMLSHELRNPLAPILLSLELMELQGETRFAQERAMIARHVRHVVRLVEDLLDVSRITHGKVQIEKERCELAPIVAAAVEMATPLVETRRHRLVASVPERGLLLSADRARLTQAIANLLTNAAKYTEPGGIIALSAAGEGSEIVVRVRDSGIGIAPDLLPRIFDLFMQGPSALDRSQGGLGIGLTIVKGVVSLHGGTVSAHSDGAGRGSEFVIRLPRPLPELQVAGVVAGEPRIPAVRGWRVLAVDDNRDAAHMLGEALRLLGCTVQVVHDGAAALAALAAFAPELVLLDIGLPGMDGYEVARRLRQANRDPGLRIVAVTGYGQPSDRERSRAAGFDDHLVKPVTLQILGQVLASRPDPGAEPS